MSNLIASSNLLPSPVLHLGVLVGSRLLYVDQDLMIALAILSRINVKKESVKDCNK